MIIPIFKIKKQRWERCSYLLWVAQGQSWDWHAGHLTQWPRGLTMAPHSHRTLPSLFRTCGLTPSFADPTTSDLLHFPSPPFLPLSLSLYSQVTPEPLTFPFHFPISPTHLKPLLLIASDILVFDNSAFALLFT